MQSAIIPASVVQRECIPTVDNAKIRNSANTCKLKLYVPRSLPEPHAGRPSSSSRRRNSVWSDLVLKAKMVSSSVIYMSVFQNI